ncbi:tripartite tricarboxylate transporter TctB family protein [Pelobacter seleniigenes]|uniref:tripartite tricarboxylate transporter TctB family protein n=1 Tax=Pelobacter seleniigenes TaxID=407188 RepID=UPI0004A779DA|nr:tripartite tricarboxylate transporter TctB family protein [Pelobacter seleniigenes]
MKLAERAFLVCMALFSVVIIWKSQELSMGSEYTIGPGFFPKVASILMLATIITMFAKTFFGDSGTKKKFFADKKLALKALYFFIALTLTVVAISFIGMFPAILLFMIFSFIFTENNSFKSSILVAILVAVIVFCIFKIWLGVPLPGFNLSGI